MTEASVVPAELNMSADMSRAGRLVSLDAVREAEFDDLGEEYLAAAVVRLIQRDKSVRQAILKLVMSCPNVKLES